MNENDNGNENGNGNGNENVDLPTATTVSFGASAIQDDRYTTKSHATSYLGVLQGLRCMQKYETPVHQILVELKQPPATFTHEVICITTHEVLSGPTYRNIRRQHRRC